MAKKVIKTSIYVFFILAIIMTVSIFISSAVAQAEHTEEETEVTSSNNLEPESTKWRYISAAIVMGTALIGAAYAVAQVGSAAVGAVSEKPELSGRVLIFVGLAEGISVFGLIIAILMLP